MRFGKPAIVADEGGDPSDIGCEHRKPEIARLEEQSFAIPEMHLAIGADTTGRSDHDGGIVERGPVAFADAGNERGAGFAGQPGPETTGLSIRNGLGQTEGLVARLEHVSGVRQFREDDQPRARFCGIPDHSFRFLQIAGLVPDVRFHLDAGHAQWRFGYARFIFHDIASLFRTGIGKSRAPRIRQPLPR